MYDPQCVVKIRDQIVGTSGEGVRECGRDSAGYRSHQLRVQQARGTSACRRLIVQHVRKSQGLVAKRHDYSVLVVAEEECLKARHEGSNFIHSVGKLRQLHNEIFNLSIRYCIGFTERCISVLLSVSLLREWKCNGGMWWLRKDAAYRAKNVWRHLPALPFQPSLSGELLILTFIYSTLSLKHFAALHMCTRE
jgi:hypothetical protein